MENILNECKEIVEEVCAKYGYDTQDIEGNDSLKTVLLKAIPAILKDSKKEERDLFYQMLRHTPIVVTENLTQEGYEALKKQYLWTNQHITEEEVDRGEYGKSVPAGAYCSEVILDENLRVQGKKSFIFVQRVGRIEKKFLGTDINVTHLIHELGHAWHAEKGQYEMEDDGTLRVRVGTAETIYSFSKEEDNKYIMSAVSSEGLMVEEALNTIAEEKAMANYMGISLEEMRKEYRNSLIPSSYQGLVTSFMDKILEQLGAEEIEKYRLYGNKELKDKTNSLMEKTDFWINKENGIDSDESPRNYQGKMDIISRIPNKRVQEFFSHYNALYFPDISTMTPLEKIENVLTQYFSLKDIKYNIPLEIYKELIFKIKDEIAPLFDEIENQRKEQEVLNVVSDVTRTDMIQISQETKDIVENGILQNQKEGEKAEKEETER